MRTVYLDNSSTSFPKAPKLGKIMGEHIDTNGYNISRGNYEKAYGVEEKVFETRELICEMLSIENKGMERNVAFTPGATAGLNMMLKGILKKGDHLLTTAMEHNAVVRPATQLVENSGIEWDTVKCDTRGALDLTDLEAKIKSNTKFVLVTHASNVCGTIIPIEEIGEICKKRGIIFGVDASQTVGSVEIDMEKSNIDVIAFPAHKALLGPQGLGVMVIKKDVAIRMEPLLSGGTGSTSDKEYMPEFLPDKFQPGTLNIPGIIGLNHSLKYIKQQGIAAIKEKKSLLTKLFLEDIKNMENIGVVGLDGIEGRCAVVSLDFMGKDNAAISYELESQFGIMTRCGLHCAPHAHKTLNTFPRGTVRFSFGYFNTEEEVKYAIDSINKVMKEYV